MTEKNLVVVGINRYRFEALLSEEIEKVCPDNRIHIEYKDHRDKVVLHVRLSDGRRSRSDKLVYSVIGVKDGKVNLATVLKKAQGLHTKYQLFETELANKRRLELEKQNQERQKILALLQGYEIPNAYFNYSSDTGKFSISLSRLSEAQARSVAMAMLMSSGGVD